MFLKEQRPETMVSQGWTGSAMRAQEPLKDQTGWITSKASIKSCGRDRRADRIESSEQAPEKQSRTKSSGNSCGGERDLCRAREKGRNLPGGTEEAPFPHMGLAIA